jgi:hypothetical protein
MREEAGQEPDQDEEREARPLSWRSIRAGKPPIPERNTAAVERLMSMERMLYHLYQRRLVSETEILQGAGLDGDEFDQIPDNNDDMYLADIGRFVAAMGGYLELRAVFPDEAVILMSEPGPEHLYDGAS